MALATLKLSDLELIYIQLNALRHHVGLHALNPFEYLRLVDGKELPPPPATVPPLSSVALVVPVMDPVYNFVEEFTDDEEDDDDDAVDVPPKAQTHTTSDIYIQRWTSRF
jgi:hypothetical protein